jgi:hypothetical protein
MRWLATAALALLVPLAARSGDAARPNTLTPKEIADGWLLLFDGETTFGWKLHPEQVQAADGALVLEGGDRGAGTITAGSFGSFALQFEYRILARGEGSPPWLSLMRPSGARRRQAITLLTAGPGRWHRETVTADDADGGARIGFIVLKGDKLALRNIKLKPLGLKPVFNGKNLDGWRQFAGKKSEFTVTKDGWIHLQNGPGDLQTTSAWADFILQIDCRSNGPHLNSGVFFRCIPRQYQNGYEAQIRNQFTKEPAQQYTIEEYDPTTHKRVGQKTVKRTAVDYGTGGIYRRFPARREVAKDHEWFTMTVAATGRHMAVWVNGFPVTDWTDNRPLAENARNGCRLKAGPISLQGHDKTTDLDFRNIRIAELPTAAAVSPRR